MPFLASRNQHTALQGAFAVRFAKQWGGGTRRNREGMGEGACFLLPRRMPSSSAWQRDGCTGCSSIRDPQSDYKDTRDLSALKKDKKDAERFTLHPSFPHWADRGLFAQGLQLVNFEQLFVLLLFPFLCDTPWGKCFQSALAEPQFHPVILTPATELVNRLSPTQHIPAPAAECSDPQILQ